MPDDEADCRPRVRVLDPATEHTLKNYLAVIVGYCDLLLGETPPEDPRHADLADMQRAAKSALSILDGEIGV